MTNDADCTAFKDNTGRSPSGAQGRISWGCDRLSPPLTTRQCKARVGLLKSHTGATRRLQSFTNSTLHSLSTHMISSHVDVTVTPNPTNVFSVSSSYANTASATENPCYKKNPKTPRKIPFCHWPFFLTFKRRKKTPNRLLFWGGGVGAREDHTLSSPDHFPIHT